MRSFKNWIEHIFNHEVNPNNEWYWEDDCDEWNESSEVTVDYLIRLFESPTTYLSDYLDEQIDQGLYYLLNSGASGMMCSLLDREVPVEKRIRGVRAFYQLFQGFYYLKCSNDMANKNWHNTKPLNHSCYMWWDICPVFPFGYPADDEFKKEVCDEAVKVMKKILFLDSLACQESALHGLGHWYEYCPDKIQSIINEFLNSPLDKPQQLIEYAEKAKMGEVL